MYWQDAEQLGELLERDQPENRLRPAMRVLTGSSQPRALGPGTATLKHNLDAAAGPAEGILGCLVSVYTCSFLLRVRPSLSPGCTHDGIVFKYGDEVRSSVISLHGDIHHRRSSVVRGLNRQNTTSDSQIFN